MKSLRISVITATFNSSRTIVDTIKSVQGQTYSNIEFVIIDGGSMDGTQSLIRQMFSSDDCILISEPDKGIYDAFNKGVRLASGDWICFLGSDDVFFRNSIIEDIIPILIKAEEENIEFVYGMVQHVKNDGTEIEVTGIDWPVARKTFHRAMNINHCGSFTRKEVFEKNGLFNVDFLIAGDYEFLLRVFKNGCIPMFIPEIIVKMQTGGVSNRLQNRSTMSKEVRLSQKMNGFNPNNLYMFLWEIRIKAYTLLSTIFGEKYLYKMADLYRQFLGKSKKWSR